MSDKVAELIEIATDVLGLAPGELAPYSGPEHVAQWDSFNALRIMVQVERRFGIRINLMAYQKARTLADLARLVDMEVAAAQS